MKLQFTIKKNYIYFILLFISVSFFLFIFKYYCFSKKEFFEKIITPKDTIYISSVPLKNMSFCFQNSGSNPVVFWIKSLDDVNYRNTNSMISSIIKESMNDEQKAFALWRVVSESGFHNEFPYNHSLDDHIDPLALVTFPYFLCGEKAGILINLAHLAGLQARAVFLEGHIVTEIFYGNSWHMFDADENVVFLNKNKKPASASELANHLDWIEKDNLIRSESDNLSLLSNYKKYFENYNENSISARYNDLSIEDCSSRNMDIKLYPRDIVSFNLHPAVFYKKLFHPRFKFETEGKMQRNLFAFNENFKQVNSNHFVFTEEIPYYIKSVSIKSEKSINCNVLMRVKNRITHQDTIFDIGNLNQQLLISKKFGAPSEADFYYSYQLYFNTTHPNLLNQIIVSTTFDFNSLTLPFTKAKPVLVDFFKGEELLLKISYH